MFSLRLSIAIGLVCIWGAIARGAEPASPAVSSSPAASSPAAQAKAALQALFTQHWNWQMEQAPEWATFLGDHRFDDRWTDLSPAAIEARKQHPPAMLAALAKIDAGLLSGQDVLSYELFQYEQELERDGDRFPSETMLVDQLDGPQLVLGQLAQSTRFRTTADYEHYVQRLAGYGKYLDQVTLQLERGIKLRWVQPRVPLRSIPQQINDQLALDLANQPAYLPFLAFPQTVPESEHEPLRKAAQQAIETTVRPALVKFRDFIEGVYLPVGDRPIGATTLPQGEAYYQYAIRRYTSTQMTAQEIHDLGLAEVKRIREQMETVMRTTGHEGTFEAFLVRLRTDPAFYYTQVDELVSDYRDICKRADAELPALFAVLPRNTYGVKAFPDYEAPSQTTARYYPGAGDGSRAGYFMVNTFRLDTRPKYEMEVLSLHEAVPGHHLQIARAQELGELPEFRRHGDQIAFIEGWGLYAESLGSEMGFYRDPFSKFGQLTYEMWRACRLVVDTGMHSLGWSRQQAIDYLKAHTAKSENDITVEIDRYIVWPGQALAYKIGELKLQALRRRATETLGDRFDIRRFHNAVLDNGALPLAVLERQIERWMEEEMSK